MGWDVVFSASLCMNKEDVKNWKKMDLVFPKTLPEGFPVSKMEFKKVNEVLKSLLTMDLQKTGHKGDEFVITSILDEEDYDAYALSIIASLYALNDMGIKGNSYFYGYLTAPEGIAYKVELSDTVLFIKLSLEEERELNETKQIKQIDKWIRKQTGDDDYNNNAIKTSKEFYSDIVGAKEIYENMMLYLRSADENALLDIVQNNDLGRFNKNKFKTAVEIKNAFRSDAGVFGHPIFTVLSDMVFIVYQLNREKAIDICLRAINSGTYIDRDLWESFAMVLGPTEHSLVVLQKVNCYISGPYDNYNMLMRWIGWLGSSPVITKEIVYDRLCRAIENLEYHALSISSALLFIHFKAAEYVDEIYSFIFNPPQKLNPDYLSEVFSYVDIPLVKNVPSLSSLPYAGTIFSYELKRRVKIDPVATYEELETFLKTRKNEIKGMLEWALDNAAIKKIIEVEPRFKDVWGV